MTKFERPPYNSDPTRRSTLAQLAESEEDVLPNLGSSNTSKMALLLNEALDIEAEQ